MMEPSTKLKSKQAEKEDFEALMRQKTLAKCRFRALVRRVIANLYWLKEDEEVYEGDNVKKRVEQAMRAKSKKQNLLSLTDKALLNKPVTMRTEAEKRYIYRKIGSLKCFKRYPNHVKRKLAAATYFRYYGPNRVIVRQHQEAEALYFVVTGDVVVSVLIYDELLKENVSINVFVMHSGDMFGEVSLLHNINRTATCTTSGHCEFLALMKQDFKEVLQKSLQKQWDEVTLAMNSFTYFNGLDEVARREGCIVAKMKSFEPNETILGDGAGIPNFVYFVLSGRCQMIESLLIQCTEALGKKTYALYDPESKTNNLKPQDESDSKATSSKILQNNSVVTLVASNKEKKTESENLIPIIDKEGKSENEETEYMHQTPHVKNEEAISKDIEENTKDEASKNEIGDSKSKVLSTNISTKDSAVATSTRLTSSQSINSAKELSKETNLTPIELSKILLQTKGKQAGKRSTRLPTQPQNTKYRTYFMQVCIFNAGSTFGFGENMRDRRIVAMTRVDCMMLPLVWLMQKNTANIWSRIQHYLEKKIPTKKQLFQHFVSQRRWINWRDSLVEDIVSRSKTVNYTTVHDVPYSIRMQEMPDI